jgi:hypothetical protein
VADDEDMLAILARAHFVVFTEEHIFWRVAGETRVRVKFMKWPNPKKKDIFNDQAIEIVKVHRKNPNIRLLAAHHAEYQAWSQTYLRMCTAGLQVPDVICRYTKDVWGTVCKITYEYPELNFDCASPLDQILCVPPEVSVPTRVQSRNPGIAKAQCAFQCILDAVEAGMYDAPPAEMQAWSVNIVGDQNSPLHGWDRVLVQGIMQSVADRVGRVGASTASGSGSANSCPSVAAEPVCKKARLACLDDDDDV